MKSQDPVFLSAERRANNCQAWACFALISLAGCILAVVFGLLVWSLMPQVYPWIMAHVLYPDGNASEVDPSDRTLSAGNFYVKWSQTNPEEVIELRWNDSGNLTNASQHSFCADDLEYFGNSWVSENEGNSSFFFSSLVGYGTTGTWIVQDNGEIYIDSISSGCPASADIRVHTIYQFFDDEARADLIKIERAFEFGDSPFAHDVRPFIPRLNLSDGFTQVIHPDMSGRLLVKDATCPFGCTAESWDESWFAIHSPTTGLGVIVQRLHSSYSVDLWLDDDGDSFTNSSSFLLLQPDGGFTGTVTETEYLCFYDINTWSPSLTLPLECRP